MTCRLNYTSSGFITHIKKAGKNRPFYVELTFVNYLASSRSFAALITSSATLRGHAL